MKFFQTILALVLLFQCAQLLHITHKGKTTDYFVDQRAYGNRCHDDKQCDGLRTCNMRYGQCQGQARPLEDEDYQDQSIPQKTEYFYYDESQTGSQCDYSDPYRDYSCDGLRTCSPDGLCQGTAR